MRILHTSDWHLGRTLHGVDLAEHHAAFLDHLVEVAREERVDAVLVAGDVYDRAIPPVPSVELLSGTLARLTELTRVVLTPGNHDSAIRLGFGSGLFRERLAVRARVTGVGSPVELPDADGGTGALVYALPYLDPDMAREHLQDGEPLARSHEAVTTAALNRVTADLRARRAGDASRLPAVVMAHSFVTGGEPSESERDIRVGGVDQVPSGVFAGRGLDYVALGHLHGPQRVGREGVDPAMRYSGSPLAFSFSEARHRKSSALVEMGSGGEVEVRLIEAPVPRRLADVRGSLAELLSRRFDDVADHWVRVTVTDPVRPAELWGRLSRRFPHLLAHRHEPEGGAVTRERARVSRADDPLEVAAGFLRAAGGRAPEDAEVAVLRRAYEETLAEERSA